MDNDEYFNWTNGFENEIKNTRKRKHDNDNEENCNKKELEFKYAKSGLEEDNQKNQEKKNLTSNGKSNTIE